MFGSTSSKITAKSVPEAERSRNMRTRQGEMARVPRSINSFRTEQDKNGNRGKQD